MPHDNPIVQLLIVLSAGFAAGLACKLLKVSPLIGYLLVGTLLGHGALNVVANDEGLRRLAEAGVLLLLFAVGLEFSLDELARLSRYLAVGGTVQMLLVAVPVMGFSMLLGKEWNAALLLGAAAAFSSTVLVFKALAEYGQVDSPHGRRAVGILLFQDAALVPLLLLVPLLTGAGQAAGPADYLLLAVKALAYVFGVVLLHEGLQRWIVPLLARLRSAELMVLFALMVLGGMALLAVWLGLPATLGAFAAGLALSGNRLTAQVDALVLPFRETFSAVFFVSLGLLLEPSVFWEEAALILPGLLGILILKTAAAVIALRLTSLPWRASWGMGMGLSQLGEFSFVLVLAGWQANVLTEADYRRMLAFALGTLVLTPPLIKRGIERFGLTGEAGRAEPQRLPVLPDDLVETVIVGVGLAGSRVAARMEVLGHDVCLVDVSPVNLHPFAQQGFRTVAGDATDPSVLARARVERAALVVVCVPHDEVGGQIVRAVRAVNATAFILVRCRYSHNMRIARRAGANHVVSEEAVAAVALLSVLEKLERPKAGA